MQLRSLLSEFKHDIVNYFVYAANTRQIKKNNDEETNSKNKIFYMMQPTYGNIGDQAIQIATKKFLLLYFKEFEIIDYNLEETFRVLPSIKKQIKKNDIVVLQGGGNFGTLYSSCERARRKIVKELHNNLVISMPVSINYSNDFYGKYCLNKSLKAYNTAAKNFVILLRDVYSFEYSKKVFSKCINQMFPDIALILEYPKRSNEYILCCLRNDSEVSNIYNRKDILLGIKTCFDKVVIYDTQQDRSIGKDLRSIEVASTLELFANAGCVITDRLHGLIFSVIAHTPCIAIKSKDNKIKGIYKWFDSIKQIHYLEEPNINNIIIIIKEELETCCFKDVDFNEQYFKYLAETIHRIYNEYSMNTSKKI